jgi:hypothetical protein
MRASACLSKSRSIARRLILLPALVVGLSLAVAGGASAQTGFQATVSGPTPKPRPCPGASEPALCGSATTNYGDATWLLDNASFTPYSKTCDNYEATATFALGDGSSLLTLDETGLICSPPGNSLSAPGGLKSYGNPFYFSGSWTVQSATGDFGSIPIGSGGTDTIHTAGASVSGAYTGTS